MVKIDYTSKSGKTSTLALTIHVAIGVNAGTLDLTIHVVIGVNAGTLDLTIHVVIGVNADTLDLTIKVFHRVYQPRASGIRLGSTTP